MNSVVLMGRLTKEPEVRTTQSGLTVAKYTLAVDRRFKKDGEPTADFIRCVAFGKGAEFAEKWLSKGIKIAISGRIQTGSYQDKDGKTVYTTDVIIDSQEFAESKSSNDANRPEAPDPGDDDFITVDGSLDDELPF